MGELSFLLYITKAGKSGRKAGGLKKVGSFGGSRAWDDRRREMRSKSGSLPPKSGDLTCMLSIYDNCNIEHPSILKFHFQVVQWFPVLHLQCTSDDDNEEDHWANQLQSQAPVTWPVHGPISSSHRHLSHDQFMGQSAPVTGTYHMTSSWANQLQSQAPVTWPVHGRISFSHRHLSHDQFMGQSAPVTGTYHMTSSWANQLQSQAPVTWPVYGPISFSHRHLSPDNIEYYGQYLMYI